MMHAIGVMYSTRAHTCQSKERTDWSRTKERLGMKERLGPEGKNGLEQNGRTVWKEKLVALCLEKLMNTLRLIDITKGVCCASFNAMQT